MSFKNLLSLERIAKEHPEIDKTRVSINSLKQKINFVENELAKLKLPKHVKTVVKSPKIYEINKKIKVNATEIKPKSTRMKKKRIKKTESIKSISNAESIKSISNAESIKSISNAESVDGINIRLIEGKVLNEFHAKKRTVEDITFITTQPYVTYGKKPSPGKVLQEVAEKWIKTTEDSTLPLKKLVQKQKDKIQIKSNALESSIDKNIQVKPKIKLKPSKRASKKQNFPVEIVKENPEDNASNVTLENSPKNSPENLQTNLIMDKIEPEEVTIMRKKIHAENPTFYPGFCQQGDKKPISFTQNKEHQNIKRKIIHVPENTNSADIISTFSWRMTPDGKLKEIKKKSKPMENESSKNETSSDKENKIREPISWRKMPKLRQKEPSQTAPKKIREFSYNPDEVREYIKKQHRERKRKITEDKLTIENLRKKKEEALKGLMEIQRKKVISNVLSSKKNLSPKLVLSRKINIHRVKNDRIRHPSFIVNLSNKTLTSVKRNETVPTSTMAIQTDLELDKNKPSVNTAAVQVQIEVPEQSRQDTPIISVNNSHSSSMTSEKLVQATTSSVYDQTSTSSRQSGGNTSLINGIQCDLPSSKSLVNSEIKTSMYRLTSQNLDSNMIRTPPNLYWGSNGRLPDPYSFMNVLKRKYNLKLKDNDSSRSQSREVIDDNYSRALVDRPTTTRNASRSPINLEQDPIVKADLATDYSLSEFSGVSSGNVSNSKFTGNNDEDPAALAISVRDSSSSKGLSVSKEISSHVESKTTSRSQGDVLSSPAKSISIHSITNDTNIKTDIEDDGNNSTEGIVTVANSSKSISSLIGSNSVRETSSKNSSKFGERTASNSNEYDTRSSQRSVPISASLVPKDEPNPPRTSSSSSSSRASTSPKRLDLASDTATMASHWRSTEYPTVYRQQLQLGVSCLESLHLLNDVQNLELAVLTQQKVREERTLNRELRELQFTSKENEEERKRFFQDMKLRHQESLSKAVGEVKDAILESTLAIMPSMTRQAPTYSIGQQTKFTTSVALQTSVANSLTRTDSEHLDRNDSSSSKSSIIYQSDFEDQVEAPSSSKIETEKLSIAHEERSDVTISSEVVPTTSNHSEAPSSSKIETEKSIAHEERSDVTISSEVVPTTTNHKTDESISDIEEISGIQMPSIHSSSISSVVEELTTREQGQLHSFAEDIEEVFGNESGSEKMETGENSTLTDGNSSSAATLNHSSTSHGKQDASSTSKPSENASKRTKTKLKMLSPLIPLKASLKSKKDYSTSEDESTRSRHTVVITDQSDLEGRVMALREQLKKRKSEAARLAREWKRRYRDTLKEKEISLQKQIKAYEEFIDETRRDLEKELDTSNQSNTSVKFTKPKIISHKSGIALAQSTSKKDESESSTISSHSEPMKDDEEIASRASRTRSEVSEEIYSSGSVDESIKSYVSAENKSDQTIASNQEQSIGSENAGASKSQIDSEVQEITEGGSDLAPSEIQSELISERNSRVSSEENTLASSNGPISVEEQEPEEESKSPSYTEIKDTQSSSRQEEEEYIEEREQIHTETSEDKPVMVLEKEPELDKSISSETLVESSKNVEEQSINQVSEDKFGRGDFGDENQVQQDDFLHPQDQNKIGSASGVIEYTEESLRTEDDVSSISEVPEIVQSKSLLSEEVEEVISIEQSKATRASTSEVHDIVESKSLLSEEVEVAISIEQSKATRASTSEVHDIVVSKSISPELANESPLSEKVEDAISIEESKATNSSTSDVPEIVESKITTPEKANESSLSEKVEEEVPAKTKEVLNDELLNTLLRKQVEFCLKVAATKAEKLKQANTTASQTQQRTTSEVTDKITEELFSNLVEDTVDCLKTLQQQGQNKNASTISLDVTQRVSDILQCLKKDAAYELPPVKHRPQDLMILSPIEDDETVQDPVTEIQLDGDEWFEEDFGLKSPKAAAADTSTSSTAGNFTYYFREIPDKPPPPYTPPQGAMLEKLAKIRKTLPSAWKIPNSEEEVDKLLVSSAEQIYNGFINCVPLEELTPDDKYFEMEARFDEITAKSERAYRLLVFDLCKASVQQLQKSTEEFKNQEPWKKIRRTICNPVIPNTKEEFVEKVQKMAKTALEMKIRSGLATKFKHKKHDFVDALLLQDMAEEETQWVNYENDELTVKLFVANSVFAQLVEEVVAIINCNSPRNKS